MSGRPAWNRRLPYPFRKRNGRIEVNIGHDRWVSRQRAWIVYANHLIDTYGHDGARWTAARKDHHDRRFASAAR
jgi:hypothetical protein